MLTRRRLLQTAGGGFGMLGLAGLLQAEDLLASPLETAGPDDLAGRLAQNPMATCAGHFPPKAKRVIWFFVNGGPSHVDTWDFKPELAKWDGKSIKEFDPAFKNTTGFFKDAVGGLMKSPFRFRQRGECGKSVSEIFPNLASTSTRWRSFTRALPSPTITRRRCSRSTPAFRAWGFHASARG